MGSQTLINLATVGGDELADMPVPLFVSSLEGMSSEAIARFKAMRKLSTKHRTALERFLLEHPEKRVGGEDFIPPRSMRDTQKKPAKPAPVSKAKPIVKRDKFEREGLGRLVIKFKAWWHGDTFEQVLKTDAELRRRASHMQILKKHMREAALVGIPEPSKAELAKAKIFEMLWGEGYHLPGGTAFALQLVMPVDFSLHRPCLDLSAGLGGGTRAMAKVYQLVVEGVESDKALASTGQMLSAKLGFSDTAPILHMSPREMTIPPAQYGTVLTRESLFAEADKEGLLAHLAQGLALGGSLVLTDYVLADQVVIDDMAATDTEASPMEAAMANWKATEPKVPHPVHFSDYKDLLTKLGFQIERMDDVTEAYLPMVREGWQKFHNCLESVKLPPESTRTLEREGNLWLARSRALESGCLRVVYIHAVMTGLPDESSSAAHDEKEIVN